VPKAEIILASQSRTRNELLKNAGIEFITEPANITNARSRNR